MTHGLSDGRILHFIVRTKILAGKAEDPKSRGRGVEKYKHLSFRLLGRRRNG